jgi:hypothetical protein
MNAASEVHRPRSTRRRRKTWACRVAAGLTLIVLAACGAPAHPTTLDREPDLVSVAGTTIPRGFISSTNEELRRLLGACEAIDANVATALPGVTDRSGITHLALIDAQCEWLNTPAGTSPGTPELIIGILANPGGGGALDQTTTILTGWRPVAGIADRAVFDPQTRTLYALANDRLWYLQLVGSAPGVAAPRILTALAGALVKTAAATR